ncbi:hypothetical protein MHTCC0001_34410 [Flavobacteriaceae bacterium MHTCC 0001]
MVALENEGTYHIDALPEHFYVDLKVHGYSQSVKYVIENLETHQTHTIVENFLPYTLPAGNNSWNLGTGEFKIKASLYKFDNAIYKCDTKTVTFIIIDIPKPCTADAGGLHAYADTVTLTGDSVMLSAAEDGNQVVPEGYSKLFVLTSGEGLVIEQVGAAPSFTVSEAGLYTIHTLVYDGREGSANFLDLGVVTIGETTGGDVLGLVIANGLCAALDVAGAPIMVEACTADAGGLHAYSDTVTLVGDGVEISAAEDGDQVVPEGYSKLFVLTSGEDLVIEQVDEAPSFTVSEAGLYTIHTLVYDGREESANFLDLGVVTIGETTGGDVLGLVIANGLCAALDVAGAPIMVEACTADAGGLHAYSDTVTLVGASVEISAAEDGDQVVPEGYSKLFVLTSGEDLVIEQVDEAPSFTVSEAGLYTIHTLVYDGREGSANFLDLGVVTIGETTGGDVLGLVIANGLCAALDVAGAPIMVEACTADAGGLHAYSDTVTLVGDGVEISAAEDGDQVVPEGYSKLFVLTSGEDLVIEQVDEAPSFTVSEVGLYTIHTLVYDGREESPNFLDLGVVTLGETTGGDVLELVMANGLCAALDVSGAPIMVETCTADAGTLVADSTTVILSGGSAMLGATVGDMPTVPEGYSKLFVLTSGEDLVIKQVDEEPSFTVSEAGLYTIHTLVYDGREESANFLDLGVVTLGETTGGDVLELVMANGLCAALDVSGAPIMVETCTADAGTLVADSTTVILSGGSAMLGATVGDMPTVPEGYSKLFVLTSGEDLVIKQVDEEPSFTVSEAGLYTIHTLVYDGREESANFLDLGVVTIGETTGGDVLGLVIANGLCAALDVAGAPVMVEDCTADAGGLHAYSDTVTLIGDGVEISAAEDGDQVVPEGYSKLFVLTSGEDLVIEQVDEAPSFTVSEAGLYTIHTLVYDGTEGSPNFLDLGVVTIGETTGGDVLGLVTANGLCVALDVAGAPVMVEACTADAGSLEADSDTVTLSGGSATISAMATTMPTVPEGYSKLFVLTSGENLVIEQVDEAPSFTVSEAGLYTIHTLVYDGREGSANFLDLGVVTIGETTGGDVLGLVTANGLCAALDVAGAPVMVEEEQCKAYSGKMYSEKPIKCLNDGKTKIFATFYKQPYIPNGYQQLYVLTDAFSLTILNVSTTPEFTVEHQGFYRIHSLVYNPDSLDLGIVKLGETTGFDVLNLVEQNNICASLDVRGAINLVIGSKWFCYFFNKYRVSYRSNSTGKTVNDDDLEAYVNTFDSYDEFEASFVDQNDEVRVYPNPTVNTLNVEIRLFDNEAMNLNIVDVRGRTVMLGEAKALASGKLTLNTNQLAKGMYIVNFTSDFRTISKKIIVQK